MKVLNKQQKELTQADVLKKLQKGGVSTPQQYELIIQNLSQQSIRLMQNRQQLKIKVDILLQKQHQLLEQHKQNKKNKKNPTIDYTRLKKQLQQKYKQFQQWKKRSYNSINKGALNLQVKSYLNKCNAVEVEIEQYRKILADQKRTFKNLQKSIKHQLKKLNKNVPQRQLLQQQNKQLRRMIWNLRIEQDLTGHVDVRVHSSIVRLQSKKRFVQKLKTMTIQQIRRQQAKSKMEIINEQLKYKKQMKVRHINQKYRQNSQRRMKTQSRLSSEKYSIQLQKQQQKIDQQIKEKEKERDAKQQQNRKLQQDLINLQNQKKRVQTDQKNLNKRLEEQQLKIAAKKAIIEKQYADVCLQVQQYEDENPLPLQMIGNETQLIQNDRSVLKGSKDTVITGLIVYQNRSGIACIRALYSNGKQTSCLPPQKYLIQKCKHKKIILQDGKDYLKWIKGYYDKSQKKLIRLQIYSNNKLKFQIGKQKQLMLKNVIAYKFDNSPQQIPVCVRVSYLQEDEQWIVTSFGVEINSK